MVRILQNDQISKNGFAVYPCHLPQRLLDQVEDICIRHRPYRVLEATGERCLLRVHHVNPAAVKYLRWKYPEIQLK